jgi:RND family efflux transporter MFP subunit
MKTKKKYILIVIVLLIIGGGYYWYSKSQSGSMQIRYITATVEKGNLMSSISASGNITVDNQATVDPTITGTVADLAVQVGDSVIKGQYLFSIINDDLSVSVAKASASYESAKNSLESAKIDEDNAEATYDKAKDADDEDNDAYTKKELSVLKDKIDLAEAKIVQSQKSLDASLADYRNTQSEALKRKVTAPIAGTINEINIKNGDDLSRTSSNSTTNAPIIIGDLETLKALVEVNEVDISKISIGQEVALKFDALDSLTVSGKVEKIDALGVVAQGVVTYNVTVGLDALDERIKPQMSVTASIISNSKEDVLIIPTSAITTEGDNYFVEILNNGMIPQKIQVQIGMSNDTQTEITSGLNVGDKVVTQKIESSSSSLSSGSSNQNNSSGFGSIMGGPPSGGPSSK